MLPKTVLYDGSHEAPPKPMDLRAGPLTMVFEPKTAFLRHIRLGDHEVVRAIYAAVRDHNWGTVPPQVTIAKSEINKDSFRLNLEVVCQQGGIDYRWQGTLSGEPSGQVSYVFEGEAHSAFQRNRIGLCVLHPITECSGRLCVIDHVDGTQEPGTFPRDIAPTQPFFEIQSVSYEAAPGIQAHIRFAGEIFEMEDQRNWSDASFKTYCTPQRLPKPVQVQPGDKVHQSATLSLSGQVRPVLPVVQGRPPQFSISTTPVLTLPPLGLCVARSGEAFSAREVERLKALRLSHLRVDLKLSSARYPELLERASTQANQLGIGLHIALTLSREAEKELRDLLPHLQRLQPKVLLWLLFHEAEEFTNEKWAQLARPVLQQYAPNVLMAAGTLDFFTEVNRNRPAADATTFPCFSVNPQVHAFDNTTMVENLAGQANNLEMAKHISAKPALVSPITLKIRSKRNETGLESAGPDLPPDVDPRQMSLFGAGWTLGNIARLAATGNAHSLTYFETIGWRGIMETESGSPLPDKFPSLPGMVFPVYHVFADIAEFPGKQIYPTHSSHPLLTEGLTLFEARGRRRILVANLTGQTQETKIKTGTCQARIRYLDETNAEQAMNEPEKFRAQPGELADSVAGKIELKLLPYALARIDIER